jgi:hypothetical protein
MIFVNCTPHPLNLNDGTTIAPSGIVARVQATFTDFEDGVCRQVFGDVEGLPEPKEGTMYIVSAVVLAAVGQSRPDVVAPATGHPQCVRENGLIQSVPGFVRP